MAMTVVLYVLNVYVYTVYSLYVYTVHVYTEYIIQCVSKLFKKKLS